ncbi:isopropylmalate/homocitrate/citramalate synthase/DNA-binding CsgD family transcriptional regulator [Actinoplanes couchii]|nr:LuxR C-terminal-related transcriptional regulator [Actinoplanes couchii]MDR6322046.1 isopropylmalate/homocitrate/citramalate synthase/DNA-binding CsgD family transcriptional regulator [Actinoplanes couchii]
MRGAPRSWPGRTVAVAPRWLATDLADAEPARRPTVLRLLIETGLTEIALGSPATVPADHEFVRTVIEQGLIPGDVTISVSVPPGEELIRRTVDSLAGAPSAIVHLTGDTTGIGILRGHGKRFGGVLALQCSPGAAAGALVEAWEPEAGRPMILSLPTAGERVMPHVLADRVEWIGDMVGRRDHACLSVRPGDERGTGLAAAELALLAGAGRVEGRLFGGPGVDLGALAGNLLADGVDPGLDLSGLGRARRAVAGGTVLTKAIRSGVPRLSAAERRVAELAAGGCTNREISVRLFVSISTVEQHLTRTYRKLNVTRRTDLAANLDLRSSGV